MKTRMAIDYWVPTDEDNVRTFTFHLMAESLEEAYQRIEDHLRKEGHTFFAPIVQVQEREG